MHLSKNGLLSETSESAHAAVPVAFGKCSGLYMPAQEQVPAADTAVLFVSPWGFEEVCLRKFHRMLADELSRQGIASLRFDYPGTGNSLDEDLQGSALESWLQSITEASAEIRTLSGCTDVTLMGHGLGAMLAVAALPRLEHVNALALLAPAYSGKMWVRETGLWWKMIATDLGLEGKQPDNGGLTIAGLNLDAASTSDIKALKLNAGMIEGRMCILTAERPGREADGAFADDLRAAGHDVKSIAFNGHEALIANPIAQKIPTEVISEIAKEIRASAKLKTAKQRPSISPAILKAPAFQETAMRFCANNRLYGVLCEPTGTRRGATVIIHGTSYERSTGWGRSSVETARQLAQNGIASFRFDAANIADSPPAAGAPDQVLYKPIQIADMEATIAMLDEKGLGPFILSGRCSGSYAAFQTALKDRHVAGLVLVNNIVFVWDPSKEIDSEIFKVVRPLEDYSARARDPETLKRLVKGQIDIPAAATNLTKALTKRLSARLTPYMGPLSATNRHTAKIADAFKMLAARKVPLKLIYAENDVGLEQLKLTFGKDVLDQPPANNIAFTLVPAADHNMTPAHANETVIKTIVDLALSLGNKRP